IITLFSFIFFFFTTPSTSDLYILSLHDALPILSMESVARECNVTKPTIYYYFDNKSELFLASLLKMLVVMEASIKDFLKNDDPRSEEHTSELQSRFDLVCRLLLEKKKKKITKHK